MGIFDRLPMTARREVYARVARTARTIETELKRPIADVLRQLYLEQGYTQEEIAAIFGVSTAAVCRWLKRYGIPARRAKWVLPDSECAVL